MKKENMKKHILNLLLTCCIPLCVCNAQPLIKSATQNVEQNKEQEAIKTIEDFYKIYTNDKLDVKLQDSLKERYLTQRMIAKVARMRYETDADPIIRAQDFTPEAMKTLVVAHLNKNWYKVSYTSTYNKESSSIEIPLRIVKIKGLYKIDYITPPWNNTAYGDGLLFDNPIRLSVDSSTPLSLLKTFYACYIMEYCSMPEDLSQRLKELRAKHCSAKSLEQFEIAAQEEEKDGRKGYDKFINGFDFDRLWLSSLIYKHLRGNKYQVCYKGNGKAVIIELSIIKKGGTYLINNINTK